MAVPSTYIVPRHRRETHQRPARRPVPWLTIAAVLGFAAGIVITAAADDTARALLAVFAIGYLLILGVERASRRFADEAADR